MKTIFIFSSILTQFLHAQTPTPVPPKLTPGKGFVKCGNDHCVEVSVKSRVVKLYLSDKQKQLVPYEGKKIILRVQTSQAEKSKAIPLTEGYEFLVGNLPFDDATFYKSRIDVSIVGEGEVDSFDFVIDEKRSPFKK